MLEDASRKLDTLSRFRSGTWTVDRQFEIVVHPRIEIRGDRFAISTGGAGEITISRLAGVIGKGHAFRPTLNFERVPISRL